VNSSKKIWCLAYSTHEEEEKKNILVLFDQAGNSKWEIPFVIFPGHTRIKNAVMKRTDSGFQSRQLLTCY